MLLILIFSIIFGVMDINNPIISLNKTDFKKINELDPYLYGVKNNNVIFLANDKILSKLKNENIDFKLLYNSEFEYQKSKKSIVNNENFVKYQEVVDKIDELVLLYPKILEKVVLGVSEEGRDIVGIKNITDGKKPKYRIAAGIHGDEAMSYQFVYDFMNELIDNKGNYQDLYDNIEFWIIPMLNPDGAISVNRRNSNNIDLNRNLGFYFEKKRFADKMPFTQKETIALKNNTISQNFTISFSFHTYGDYINYVWNFSPDRVGEEAEILYLSSIYKSYTNYTITEGFDWYRTTGDLNDYSYGTVGNIDWTIEIADKDNENKDVYINNKNALIDILRTNNQGVEGIVKDKLGNKIKAAITIKEKESLFYSFDNGYFYRFLKPGNYTLMVRANGYQPVYKDIIIEKNQRENVEIIMDKLDDKIYAWRIIEVISNLESYNNIKLPKNILFNSDKRYFTFNGKGKIFLELPKRDKNYNLSIVFKKYNNVDLSIIGYKDIDKQNLIREYKYGENIKISKDINFIEIIENSINQKAINYAEIDSIVLNKTDYCKDTPCKDKSKNRCISLTDRYECLCSKGYYDNNGKCSILTVCSPNPCIEENMNICYGTHMGYSCSCNNGYILNNNICEKIDCSFNPCRENQNCIDNENSYRCECKKGYSLNNGNCEKIINNCSYSVNSKSYWYVLILLFLFLKIKKYID